MTTTEPKDDTSTTMETATTTTTTNEEETATAKESPESAAPSEAPANDTETSSKTTSTAAPPPTVTRTTTMCTKDISEEEKRKYRDWPRKGIKEPHNNDVLFGRGGGTNHHSGNKLYRKMVEERKVEYVNCKRLDKPLVALGIIKEWRDQVPPGRFLKMDDKTGVWNDVGDKKAREKTSQALREKAPEIRKELEKEKNKQQRIERGETVVDSDDEPEDAGIRTTRFAKGTNLDGKPGIVVRDHSLGRDYVSEDGVSLQNFTWFKDGGASRETSGSGVVPQPMPYGPFTAPPPIPPYGYPGSRSNSGSAPFGGVPAPYPPQQVASFDSRVMSWGAMPGHPPSSAPPPTMPGYGYPPAPTTSWTQRDHSLSNNPLPNASLTQPGYPTAFDSGQWQGGFHPAYNTNAGAYPPPPNMMQPPQQQQQNMMQPQQQQQQNMMQPQQQQQQVQQMMQPQQQQQQAPQMMQQQQMMMMQPQQQQQMMQQPQQQQQMMQQQPQQQQKQQQMPMMNNHQNTTNVHVQQQQMPMMTPQQHQQQQLPMMVPQQQQNQPQQQQTLHSTIVPPPGPPMHDYSTGSNSSATYAVDPVVASQWSSTNSFPPPPSATLPPPVASSGVNWGVSKPDMVKRTTSHQNETAETKLGYDTGNDFVKRATLDRERSLASSRMKEQFQKQGGEEKKTDENNSNTLARPSRLTLEERMSTLDIQQLEQNVVTKPVTISHRASTIEALTLDFDNPPDQVTTTLNPGHTAATLEDLFQEMPASTPPCSLHRPFAMSTRITTRDLIDFVEEPIEEV